MSQLSLLRTRRFAPLFCTQFLGALNDNVYKNALIILITFSAAAGESSAMLVSLSAGLFILPFLLFSATAGQLADKLEKSLLIRRVKAAEIAIMGLGALCLWVGNLPALIAVLFLMGSQSAVFGPLKYGILPQHLEEHQLTGGNGLIQTGTFLAILIGTGLGGVLAGVERIGPEVVAAVVVALAVAGWFASRSIPIAPPADPDLRMDWNPVRATWRLVGHAREDRTVLFCIVGIAWFWFVGATFLQLLPSFTKDSLGGGPNVVALVLTAFSVGIGVGALACERLSAGRIELGIVPYGAGGLVVFSAAVLPVHALAAAPPDGAMLGVAQFLSEGANVLLLADFVLLAVSGGIYIVPLYALVQARSHPARRSRVIAATNVLDSLFMVVSAGLTIALLAAGVSISGIFLVTGVLTVAVTGLVFGAVPEFGERLAARLGRAARSG